MVNHILKKYNSIQVLNCYIYVFLKRFVRLFGMLSLTMMGNVAGGVVVERFGRKKQCLHNQ